MREGEQIDQTFVEPFDKPDQGARGLHDDLCLNENLFHENHPASPYMDLLSCINELMPRDFVDVVSDPALHNALRLCSQYQATTK